MNADPLFEDKTLPMLLAPPADDNAGHNELVEWIQQNVETLDDWVHRAGAVLVRGYNVDTPEAFRDTCEAVRAELRNYVGGDSPRNAVTDQVYTSTEYPAELEVLLHNELAYAGWSPERVFFGCMTPAKTGGETHIADARQVFSQLRKEVRRRFEDLGVIYHQYLWDASCAGGPGQSWQATFETEDHTDVELYLIDSEMKYEWTIDGLRTSSFHQGVIEHPLTGERCWNNQADQWHREMPSVKDSVGDADSDKKSAGIETFGNHVTFGDGSEIPLSDLLHIREVSRACEVVFPWQKGDFLILDNVLAMHGRKPFTGDRDVIVAMA
ncbi:MAG: TauD/TfdA family dioxygenase [Pseudomonadota bacterium]